MGQRSNVTWNREYRAGAWGYLSTNEQAARYALVASLCRLAGPRAKVLDVGCGEALLTEWLNADVNYVGMDLSEVAIELARRRCQNRAASFIVASASDGLDQMQGQFDCIIFNEILYYLDNPPQYLARALDLVRVGGTVVISISAFHSGLWENLYNLYRPNMSIAVRLADLPSGKAWWIGALTRTESCHDEGT